MAKAHTSPARWGRVRWRGLAVVVTLVMSTAAMAACSSGENGLGGDVTLPSVSITVPSVTVPSVTVPSVTVPSIPSGSTGSSVESAETTSPPGPSTTLAPTTESTTTPTQTTLAPTTTTSAATTTTEADESSSADDPPWVLIALVAVILAGGVLAAMLVTRRRHREQSAALASWQSRGMAAVTAGTTLASVAEAVLDPTDAETEARRWDELAQRTAVLVETQRQLATDAPDAASVNAVAETQRSTAVLGQALDAHRALRIGPPPPTGDQLDASRALVRQRIVEFERAQAALRVASTPPAPPAGAGGTGGGTAASPPA